MQGHGQRHYPRTAQHNTPCPALQADQQVVQVNEPALVYGMPAALLSSSLARLYIIQGAAWKTIVRSSQQACAVREPVHLDAHGGCPPAQPGPRLVTVVARLGPALIPINFRFGSPERVLHANQDVAVCACSEPADKHGAARPPAVRVFEWLHPEICHEVGQVCEDY